MPPAAVSPTDELSVLLERHYQVVPPVRRAWQDFDQLLTDFEVAHTNLFKAVDRCDHLEREHRSAPVPAARAQAAAQKLEAAYSKHTETWKGLMDALETTLRRIKRLSGVHEGCGDLQSALQAGVEARKRNCLSMATPSRTERARSPKR